MANKYQVCVYGARGERKIINLCDTEEEMKNMTVQQLKEKTLKEFPYIRDPIRLVFTYKCLDDDDARLCDYGIEHLSVIHTVIKVAGGGNFQMGDKKDKNRSMERLFLL